MACAIAAGLIAAGHAAAETLHLYADSVIVNDPNAVVLGGADPRAQVSFEISLAVRDQAALDARMSRGEQIGAAELARVYWPTAAQFDAVLGWLTAQGFTIEPETDSVNHLAIRASGSAALVAQALHVTLSRVRAEGQEWIAARNAPSLPDAIAPYVAAVNGLQPYQHMRPIGFTAGQLTGLPANRPANPRFTITSWFPAGLSRAFQGLPNLTESGAGTRTAILIDAFPLKTDLTSFWTLTGIGQSLSNIEEVQAVSGASSTAPSGEETLDTEYSSGVGYGSKVRIYATKSLSFTNLDAGFRKILSDIAGGVAIQQLSISLGACESAVAGSQIATDETLLQSIAAQGVTILVSSGDSGAHECGSSKPVAPSWYSTSPYVTAAGGSHLVGTAKTQTSPVTIKLETGWTGSGGGISGVFALPAWQSAAGLNYSGRAVPDVASDADPATGVVIWFEGSEMPGIGGTSASAPAWAGWISWINQARIAAGKPTLGALGPRIYSLSADFRDIVKGCNGGYCAGVGYDLVTGLGSPVLKNLLPALVAQD